MSTAQRFTSNRKQRVRTLWISDVHLGTRDCQAEHLAAFLKRYHADRIYLVGDIIDGWKLRGGIYWPQAHTNVIRRLLTLSKRGTEVIYVTGNHDEFLRRYSSLILGNIRLVDEAVHSTADGRKLLVIHGDQFDVITRYHRWLAFLGDSAYEFTLLLNRWLNHWRRRWGYGYWSLSAYLKHKVKTAVNFISDFEEAIAHECHKRGLDGVVCGHIHHAEIRRIEGVDYLNCGDWVESCTALIEHWDGSIQLYRLAEEQARLAAQAAAMRLLIVSDAWLPQVNGVVTSLLALQRELELLGHQVRVLSPADFRCLPCPSYPEIPLAWNLWRLGGLIEAFAPDAVHLATEGPLGWAARRWLGKRGLDFTSAIHTRFPEYLRDRCPWLPLSWGYAFLRTFHRPSRAVLVSTPRLRDEFCAWRFQHLRLWRKGVDTELFHPAETPPAKERPPVFLYVGRLATEKNLEAFLDLELPGEKWLVGDGPQRAALEQRYPQARFLGYRHGRALADAYRAASVLVFPSLTDTYGLVMLEALACGVPVAAFAVPGPLDVLQQGVTGVMHEDLGEACRQALALDRQACGRWAREQSWRVSAEEFLALQASGPRTAPEWRDELPAAFDELRG